MTYLSDLSPTERTMQARIAANVKHATTDGRDATAAARAASPGSDEYWLDKVDPERELAIKERRKRARNAKSAHFTKLALAGHRAKKAAEDQVAS